MKNLRTIDYMNKPEERKKVTNLLQTGNFRRVSSRRPVENNISRNRLILVILAVFVLITGFYSIFF